MKFDQDDLSATIGTIIVHAVLLLILSLIFFTTKVADEDSGILVDIGDYYVSTGPFEPRYTQQTPQIEIPPQPQVKTAPAKEELITQNTEETVAMPASKKKDEQVSDENAQRAREAAERKRIDEEKKRQEAEQKLKEEVINNQMSKSFGSGASLDKVQGPSTTVTQNQGSPSGNSDKGSNDEIGGFGPLNLGGLYTGEGGLQKPKILGQEVGKIVFDIVVTPEGNVISAIIGRGTNIDDADMRKGAEDAAKSTKFNKTNKTQNRPGTIIYNYTIEQEQPTIDIR